MAKLNRLTESSAVLTAIEEFNRLGRPAFLKKYGFGKADKFFLVHDGRHYDSKAIAGVAYGKQFRAEGALSHKGFYGGLSETVPKLRELGFVVTEQPPRLLVLAQNELNANPEHDWQDVEGERYQSPNGYRNKIVPGTKFIYYRGKRRKSGVGEPEYFGWGVIGDVMKDPASDPDRAARQKWIAEIAEYWPFSRPIPFRGPSGEYLETGTRSVVKNFFGVGVRNIDPDRFADILKRGGFEALAKASPVAPIPVVQKPEVVAEGKSLLVTVRYPTGDDEKRTSYGNGRRYSGQAKQVGDAAEELFLNWLREREPDSDRREEIVWVAAEGQTPGYDIEDRRSRQVVAYEIKGTRGAAFPSVEITANELMAAEALAARYNLVLISDCQGTRPIIEIIPNPASLLKAGALSSTPILFRLQKQAEPDR